VRVMGWHDGWLDGCDGCDGGSDGDGMDVMVMR